MTNNFLIRTLRPFPPPLTHSFPEVGFYPSDRWTWRKKLGLPAQPSTIWSVLPTDRAYTVWNVLTLGALVFAPSTWQGLGGESIWPRAISSAAQHLSLAFISHRAHIMIGLVNSVSPCHLVLNLEEKDVINTTPSLNNSFISTKNSI